MIVTHTLAEFNSAYENLAHKDSVGFVPTMGALHQGHLGLVRNSKANCEHTIVSIFVNPTQFNNPDDLHRYPRTLEADSLLLESVGVDIVFAPFVEEVYPTKDERVFDLGGLDQYGEGAFRPGHFNGVAQVVTRLFDIVQPTKAFFGEKDFQQLAIVEYFTKNLNYNIEIVRCPIARAEDGLALSSRNELLTKEQRAQAPNIFKTISKAKELSKYHSPAEVIDILTKEINETPCLETEYIEIINAQTLEPINNWADASTIQLSCAIFAAPIRLIDNIKIK